MSTTLQKNYRFVIRRPDKTRRSYDIVCDEIGGPKRTQYTINKLARFSQQATTLKTINEQFKTGVLTTPQAEIAIGELKTKLEEINQSKKSMRRRANIAEANLRIFNSYWDKYYADNRKIVDKKRTSDQFHYALSVLGPDILLPSVDEKTLQKHWNAKLRGTAHRRYGLAIRALLRHIGRDIQLELDANDKKPVEFITLEELKKMIRHCPDQNVADAIITYFCMGGRQREIFALVPRSIKGNVSVFVEYQIDRKDVRREIKNKNKHDALIIAFGLESIKRWCALPFEKKMELRYTIEKTIGDLGKSVLNRRIVTHFLRHSYAIHLLDCGVPLDRVAQFLGDSLEVTQRHYTGFVVTDHTLAHLSRLVNPK